MLLRSLFCECWCKYSFFGVVSRSCVSRYFFISLFFIRYLVLLFGVVSLFGVQYLRVSGSRVNLFLDGFFFVILVSQISFLRNFFFLSVAKIFLDFVVQVLGVFYLGVFQFLSCLRQINLSLKLKEKKFFECFFGVFGYG